MLGTIRKLQAPILGGNRENLRQVEIGILFRHPDGSVIGQEETVAEVRPERVCDHVFPEQTRKRRALRGLVFRRPADVRHACHSHQHPVAFLDERYLLRIKKQRDLLATACPKKQSSSAL